MSGQASMYMFESPLRAVPATPVITYRIPQQRSSEEATVPSFSGDLAQPSTPLTHDPNPRNIFTPPNPFPFFIERLAERVDEPNQRIEQFSGQHYTVHSNQNVHKAKAVFRVLQRSKSVETSEQVVPCIPSPTMKTISPECTPGKSTGMVPSHGRYLTGMAGSRQCLQQRRLRISKRLLKSQTVTYSQNQTETNKQIRLFTGDDIFA
ncbi:uncharacterized protein LOC112562900 isoform X2 [Pomacea canaliculata]|uniref:uncharacterized protein LOC112562900 isoform X2 n=1 Tax=Pomacea canaliculata TaxID=400727 RepID=UPI000D728D8E|nr:uncharacterized protein LOC112562900 isoform X2 [Pomacea canaliculata]